MLLLLIVTWTLEKLQVSGINIDWETETWIILFKSIFKTVLLTTLRDKKQSKQDSRGKKQDLWFI